METYSNAASESASESQYFNHNAAPRSITRYETLAREFITHHKSQCRRVVLVTSGGTTVPLENQTVRFLDNFSAGTRGATSAEYFLQAGYAVIFLHRQFSQLPYSRHYSHSTHCFLDFMGEDEAGQHVIVKDEHREEMLHVLREYVAAKDNNMLLLLPFVTVTDYLWELRAIAKLMRPLGASGLFYLAAAVSDFFIPENRMAEHKIQATEEYNRSNSKSDGALENHSGAPLAAKMNGKRLVVDLEPVPKFLRLLTAGWAPGCMIISFKLETDPSLLLTKAKDALAKYQHHLVIGNLLATRKWEVVLVTADDDVKWIRVPAKKRNRSKSGIEALVGEAERAEKDRLAQREVDIKNLEKGGVLRGLEIESLIVPEVAHLHSKHIEKAKT